MVPMAAVWHFDKDKETLTNIKRITVILNLFQKAVALLSFLWLFFAETKIMIKQYVNEIYKDITHMKLKYTLFLNIHDLFFRGSLFLLILFTDYHKLFMLAPKICIVYIGRECP